jgi:hypothetical protein
MAPSTLQVRGVHHRSCKAASTERKMRVLEQLVPHLPSEDGAGEHGGHNGSNPPASIQVIRRSGKGPVSKRACNIGPKIVSHNLRSDRVATPEVIERYALRDSFCAKATHSHYHKTGKMLSAARDSTLGHASGLVSSREPFK